MDDILKGDSVIPQGEHDPFKDVIAKINSAKDKTGEPKSQAFSEIMKEIGTIADGLEADGYPQKNIAGDIEAAKKNNYLNQGAQGIDSIAFGYGAATSGDNDGEAGKHAIAIGFEAKANAASSIALGDNATTGAGSSNSVAIGKNSRITDNASDSIVIGNGAKATQKNSIALGKGAETGTVSKVISAKIGDITYGNFAGDPVTNDESRVLSIGKAGEERTITNVAAGKILENSTDAINGSQLYATNKVLSNLAKTSENVLGDSFVLNENGEISVKNGDIGGTGKTTVSEAVASLGNKVITLSDGVNNKISKNLSSDPTFVLAGNDDVVVEVNDTNDQMNFSINKGEVKLDDNKVVSGDAVSKAIAAAKPSVVGEDVIEVEHSTQNEADKFIVSLNKEKLINKLGDTYITKNDYKVGDGIEADKWKEKLGVADLGLHYKADGESDRITTLAKGFTFSGDKNIKVSTEDGGVVKHTLNEDLVGINSIAGNGQKISLTSAGTDLNNGKIINMGSGTIGDGSTDAVTGGDIYKTLQEYAKNSDISNKYLNVANANITFTDGANSNYKIDLADNSASRTLKFVTLGVETLSNDKSKNLSATIDGNSGELILKHSLTPTFDKLTVGDFTITPPKGDGEPGLVVAGGYKIAVIADGEVTNGSQAAVNGRQLYKVREEAREGIRKNKASITENEEAIAKNKTAIESNKNDIATNKENIQTNTDAIGRHETAIQNNKNDIATNKGNIQSNTNAINENRKNIEKGWNIKVVDGSTYTEGNIQLGEELTVEGTGNIKTEFNQPDKKLTVKMVDNPSFTSAKIGGIDLADGKISNVSSSAATGSVATYEQLKPIFKALNLTPDGTSGVVNDGDLTGKYLGKDNVEEAFKVPMTFEDTHNNKAQVSLGEKVAFVGDNNIDVSKTDGTAKHTVAIKLKDVVKVGNVKPVTIDGKEGIITGLTNIEWDGTDKTTSNKAATEAQLGKIEGAIKTDISNINNTLGDMKNVVKYDDDTKNNIELKGINGTLITNVAKGKIIPGSRDAVTGAQFDTLQKILTGQNGKGTDLEFKVSLNNNNNFEPAYYTNVKDALEALKHGWRVAGGEIDHIAGATHIEQGETLVVSGDKNISTKISSTTVGRQEYKLTNSQGNPIYDEDGQQKVEVFEGKIGTLSIALSDTPEFTNITVTNPGGDDNSVVTRKVLKDAEKLAVKYDNDAKDSITLNSSGTTIKNVKYGKNDADAVNVKQIKDLVGGNVAYDGTKWTGMGLEILKGKGMPTEAPTGILDAIKANISAINRGLVFEGDNENNSPQYLGSKLSVKTDNIGTDFEGKNLKTYYKLDSDTSNGTIKIGLSKNPEFDSMTLGKIKMTPGADKLTLSSDNGLVVLDGLKAGKTPDSAVTKGEFNALEHRIGSLDVSVGGQVQELQDGTAGTMVYTNSEGDRLVKVRNNYYKKADVDDRTQGLTEINGKYYNVNAIEDGHVIPGQEESGKTLDVLMAEADRQTDIIISAVKPHSTDDTKTPMSVGNIASGLGLTDTYSMSDTSSIKDDQVKGLLSKTKDTELNRVSTVRDLQAVAKAGLNFKGNDKKEIQRPVGSLLGIEGRKDTEYITTGATTNSVTYSDINMITHSDGEVLRIEMLKSPKFEGIVVNNGKDGANGKNSIITVDDNGNLIIKNGVSGQDGKPGADGLAGKDGKDGQKVATIKDVDNLSKKLGLNGNDGSAGTSGTDGPAGKDGLDRKSILDKVQGLRDGIAGTMVYTDKDGNRLVREGNEYYKQSDFNSYTKANDGNYYDKVDENGKPEDGATKLEIGNLPKVAKDTIRISAVDPASGDSKDNRVVLNNIKSALDIKGDFLPIKNEEASKAVDSLLTQKTDLDKAATGRDLQALAQAGINIKGNDTDKISHIPLSGKFNIIGSDTDYRQKDNSKLYSAENLITHTDGSDTIRIEMLKSPSFKDLVLNGSNGADGKSAIVTVDSNGNLVVKSGTDGKVDKFITEKTVESKLKDKGFKVKVKDKELKVNLGDTLEFTNTDANIVLTGLTKGSTSSEGTTEGTTDGTTGGTAEVKSSETSKIPVKQVNIDLAENMNLKSDNIKAKNKVEAKEITADKVTTKEIVTEKITTDKFVTDEVQVGTVVIKNGEISGVKTAELDESGHVAKEDEDKLVNGGTLNKTIDNLRAENAQFREGVQGAIQQNSQRISKLETKVNKGLANAAAMGGINFMEIGVNQATVGAAVGGYEGTQAVAVGVQAAPTQDLRVNAKVSLTPGSHSSSMYSVGASWRFDLR